MDNNKRKRTTSSPPTTPDKKRMKKATTDKPEKPGKTLVLIPKGRPVGLVKIRRRHRAAIPSLPSDQVPCAASPTLPSLPSDQVPDGEYNLYYFIFKLLCMTNQRLCRL